MNERILEFFENVDERIYARGEDYYTSGRIASLTGDGARFAAKVEGSGYAPYTVEIGLTEQGEVEDFLCDCPYDGGSVCKHIVAVLLAIADGEYDEKKPKKRRKPAEKRVSLETLVSSASKQTLAQLVLDYAALDEAFCDSAFFALNVFKNNELSEAKELIKASIRRNTRRGFADYDGCDHICRDMGSVLDQAEKRLTSAQPGAALALARSVLVSGIKLASGADSSSGALSEVINEAFSLIERSVKGFSSRSKQEKNKALDALIKDARHKAFDGWEDWRYDLISIAAGLADKKSVARLYDVLDEMKKQQESGDDRAYFDRDDKLARYRILLAVEGKTAARSYLNENLEVDELRRIAVEEDIASGDFKNAERLCQERVSAKKDASYLWSSWWHEALYEIYCHTGQKEKQLVQAKRLLMMGELGRWGAIKDLLVSDGRWEVERTFLLAQLKTARPYHEYMGILSYENELAMLMAEVRVHPETAFRYGAQLCEVYRADVCALCSEIILNDAKSASDRSMYRKVCDLLETFAGLGGADETAALIRKLQAAYPRRPAMLDELEKLGRRMANKKDEKSKKTNVLKLKA